jgi:hypothetical protein
MCFSLAVGEVRSWGHAAHRQRNSVSSRGDSVGALGVFVSPHRKWIRPVIFETVRKITACRTPALGGHIYQCPNCHKIEIVPHSCKSRFCPSCGKLATGIDGPMGC